MFTICQMLALSTQAINTRRGVQWKNQALSVFVLLVAVDTSAMEEALNVKEFGLQRRWNQGVVCVSGSQHQTTH